MGLLTWTWPLFHPSSTQGHAFQGGLSSSRKEGCRVKRVLYGWIAGRSGPGYKQRTCELTSLEGFKAACQPCPEVPNWLPVYLPLHGTDSHLFLCIWKSVCFLRPPLCPTLTSFRKERGSAALEPLKASTRRSPRPWLFRSGSAGSLPTLAVLHLNQG